MTTKKRLHKLVDELTDAEVLRARVVVEDEQVLERRRRAIDEATVAGYTRFPPGDLDEWGDLRAQTSELAERATRRLDEEERAAGHEPW